MIITKLITHACVQTHSRHEMLPHTFNLARFFGIT